MAMVDSATSVDAMKLRVESRGRSERLQLLAELTRELAAEADPTDAHTAIVIANARLLANSQTELGERQRITERLRVLSEASKDFAAATGDPQGLLDMVTHRLGSMVGDLCALRLVGDDDQLLDAGSSAYHPDPAILAETRELMAHPQRAGEGISGRIVATGTAILIATVSPAELAAMSEPRYRPYLERLGVTSLLGVPLVAHARVIGVITLTRDATGRPYTEEDLLFAQDLATHAALAIKNSRLLASLQRELIEREKAEVALARVQDQLRHAQKMDAVGRFAGGIAHDFNNLLSVVLNYCTFMTDALAPHDPMREDLGQIQRAGERATELTRQLLDLSREQAIEPRIVNLEDIVKGMDRTLQRMVGECVELHISTGRHVGRVKAEPGHLEQVITNLAINARDAMPRGGTLTIEMANVELDDAYARDHLGVRPGPHVVLAITDTGIGMTTATQERIFEPFFTTKGQGNGAGLGLSTVFAIVKQCGGSIRVHSTLDKGTTFKVFLPRTDESERRRSRTVELAALQGSETILLVDDDDRVRLVARGILKRRGYRLLEASSGNEALVLAEQHRGEIDLLLTDVVMPSMTGCELAEHLVRLRPTLKVLFMSGYTEDAILQRRIGAPGVSLMLKPLTPEALLRKVRSVIESVRTVAAR